jgi:ATF/CREB family transcription factor
MTASSSAERRSSTMTSPSTKRSASPPTTAVASTTGQASNPSKAISNQPAIGGRARPPPRSNFDLEPNPFEHSFSSTSVVSHSSSTDTPKQDANSVNGANNSSNGTSKAALTNGPNGAAAGPNAVNGTQTTKENDDSKPMLPPLSSIESPADHGFGPWGLASSLRSGPLSPAMLAGPASQQTPSLGLGAFDSSFVRTGLTPDVNRTGLTPLIGGPGGFPPPSPNTAALFALVNGTSSASLGSSVAITPGTLNAITGALSSSLGNLHPPTSMSLDTQNQQLVDAAAQQQSQGQFHQPDAYSAPHDSASHAISNAASALYLLSQQQSSLQRNQNQAQTQVQGQVNPSAVSGPVAQPESPTTTAAAATRRATKRKAVEAPAPVPRGKKTKSAASVSVNTRGANRRKNSKLDEEEDDEDDDEDDDDDIYMEGMGALPGLGANARTNSTTNRAGGAKKPETEEEKRRNFLERNRQGKEKMPQLCGKGVINSLILICISCPQMSSTQKGVAASFAGQGRVSH